MLTKGDDYPIHQTAEPIAFAGTDRNFYDRYFFNAYLPDGSAFVAIAFGVYPHLNIADAHISLTEERLLESAFVAEGWDSEYPKSLFIDESLARAREAAESDDAMFDYINEKAQAFTTKSSQKEVLGVVKNILKSDGETHEENEFYNLLVQALPKVGK